MKCGGENKMSLNKIKTKKRGRPVKTGKVSKATENRRTKEKREEVKAKRNIDIIEYRKTHSIAKTIEKFNVSKRTIINLTKTEKVEFGRFGSRNGKLIYQTDTPTELRTKSWNVPIILSDTYELRHRGNTYKTKVWFEIVESRGVDSKIKYQISFMTRKGLVAHTPTLQSSNVKQILTSLVHGRNITNKDIKKTLDSIENLKLRYV